MSQDDDIICFCNNVARGKIIKAVAGGAQSIKDIYDRTGAGVGPCGGSCRALIREHLEDETLLNAPQEPRADRATVSRELVEAVSLFNRRYYWEAHEALEELWKDEKDPIKLFYQGLIQACATFYHVLNSNPRSVLKIAPEARTKLKSYAPEYLGLRIDPLIESLESYGAEAREVLGRGRAGFDYDSLPRIPIRGSDT